MNRHEMKRLWLAFVHYEFVVLGIDTTIPFHIKLLNNDIFRSGKFNTNFLEQNSIMNDEC